VEGGVHVLGHVLPGPPGTYSFPARPVDWVSAESQPQTHVVLEGDLPRRRGAAFQRAGNAQRPEEAPLHQVQEGAGSSSSCSSSSSSFSEEHEEVLPLYEQAVAPAAPPVYAEGQDLQNEHKEEEKLGSGDKPPSAPRQSALQVSVPVRGDREDSSGDDDNDDHEEGNQEPASLSPLEDLQYSLNLGYCGAMHMTAFTEGLQVLIDLPFALCGLFTMVTVWRANQFVSDCREAYARKEDWDSDKYSFLQKDVQKLQQFDKFRAVLNARSASGAYLHSVDDADQAVLQQPASSSSSSSSSSVDQQNLFKPHCNCSEFKQNAGVCKHIPSHPVLGILIEDGGQQDQAGVEAGARPAQLSSQLTVLDLEAKEENWRVKRLQRSESAALAAKKIAQDFPEIEEENKKYTAVQDTLRCLCLEHAFSFFLDIPFILLTVILSFTIYRLPNLLKPVDHVNDRRRRALAELCKTLVDLPFIVWGSVLLLTGPRGVLLLRDIVKHCENNRQLRLWCVVCHTALLVLDLVALLCSPLLVGTLYRLPRAYRQANSPYTTPWAAPYTPGVFRGDVQVLVVRQSLMVMVDTFFLLLALPVLASWRGPTLLASLYKEAAGRWPSVKFKKVREALRAKLGGNSATPAATAAVGAGACFRNVPVEVVSYQVMPFLDIRDVTALASCAHEQYRVGLNKRYWRNRFESDFPSTLASQFNGRLVREADSHTNGLGWKTWYVQEELKRQGVVKRAQAAEEYRGSILSGCRLLVVIQLLNLIIDTPFVAMGLLVGASGLRTAPLVRDLCQCWTMRDVWKARRTASNHVWLLVLDAISLPCCVGLALTLYKTPFLYQRLTSLPAHPFSSAKAVSDLGLSISERQRAHYIIISSFFNLLVDLPFNLLGLLCCCTVYRGLIIRAEMRQQGLLFGKSEHRKICWNNFVALLLDIPFWLMALFLLFAPWRLAHVCKSFKRHIVEKVQLPQQGPQGPQQPAAAGGGAAAGDGAAAQAPAAADQPAFDPEELVRTLRKLLCRNAAMAPVDIVCLFCLLVVVGTVIRLPTLVTAFKRKASFHTASGRALVLVLQDLVCVFVLLPLIVVPLHRFFPFVKACRYLLHYYRNDLSTEQQQLPTARDLMTNKADDDDDAIAEEAEEEDDRTSGLAAMLDPEDAKARVRVQNLKKAKRFRRFRRALHSQRTSDGFGTFDPTTGKDHYNQWLRTCMSEMKKVLSVQPSGAQWVCPACTLINNPLNSKCQVCATPQPATLPIPGQQVQVRPPAAPGGVAPAAEAEAEAEAEADNPKNEGKVQDEPDGAEQRSAELMDNTFIPTGLDWPDFPLSLSFFRPTFYREARLSVMRIHTLLLFPVRLLGCLFLPSFMWVNYRQSSFDQTVRALVKAKKDLNLEDQPDDEELKKQISKDVAAKSKSISFWWKSVQFWWSITPKFKLDFFSFNLEKFLVCNIMIMPFLLFNELAVLFSKPAMLLVLATTVGRTDRVPLRNRFDLPYVGVALQGVTFPLLLCYLLGVAALPIGIYFIVDNISLTICIAVGVPVLLAFFGTWHLTFKYCRHHNRAYRPLVLYMDLARLFLCKGRLWRPLRALLLYPSLAFRKLTKSGVVARILGELLITVLVIAWIGWPIAIVVLAEAWMYLIIALPLFAMLLYRARALVRDVWNDTVEDPEEIECEDPAPPASQPGLIVPAS